MDKKWGLCQMLAWIAFRRDDMLTDNPKVLRSRIRRHKSALVEKNPAADLLKAMRAGKMPAYGRLLPIGERQKMSPIDWMQISEDDVWRMAELDWLDSQGEVKTEAKFVPNLRAKFVADDGREFDNLLEWPYWLKQLPRATWNQIWQSGILNRKQCRDFWRWMGRTDPVPKRLAIYFNSEDVDRLIDKELASRRP